MTLQQEATQSRAVRVAVIGTGFVGSSFAYTLLLSGLAAEIVLIDANQARAEGEAMDMSHALPFSHAARVWAGRYADCGEADVVVISAGVNQKPGESRLDLAKRNADIFEQVIPQVAASGFGGVIVVATNPVDVMTYVTRQISGLPERRVVGSGTVLDSARFRYEIGRHCGVDAGSVQAAIIGEHGDSSVPVWSGASVGGLPVAQFCQSRGLRFDQEVRDGIFGRARDAAREVIVRKGATYYAIAAGLLRVVEAILRDQSTVLPVSSMVEGYEGIHGVCLSLPTIVGRSGIVQVLAPRLEPEEADALRHSAQVLGASIASLSHPSTA